MALHRYLSGVDAPLKTNLEMVQILKRLNETANADIEEFPSDRIKRRNVGTATAYISLVEDNICYHWSHNFTNF
ncbi:hypothetical protein ANCDUO_06118 [Ancylostoma duodenale]|uniref:Uncharacterized protein n=1 Tax=Ancylostoma duodenale TaxID=51022 RepID=A0A0C2GQH4_9BILA|nr:hypothetical protein ANCDUO_06118 [Ancylostoma duodenale]